MIVSVISLKLVSLLIKDMVNLDLTKRALTYAGQQLYHIGSLVNESIQNSGTSNELAFTNSKQQNVPTLPHAHNWLKHLFTKFQETVLWIEPTESFCRILAWHFVVYL